MNSKYLNKQYRADNSAYATLFTLHAMTLHGLSWIFTIILLAVFHCHFIHILFR